MFGRAGIAGMHVTVVRTRPRTLTTTRISLN